MARRLCRKPAYQSSAFWRAYFTANQTAPRPVPWHLGANVAAVERKLVASSIQEFQLGESSEGRHLIRGAQMYAVREEDADYLAAMRLFIAEEQRHAQELGRFLDLAGIPRRSRTWADSAFRRLRRFGGLERSIAVLVTAEIIATVYYAALRDATGSPVLRKICELILRDEAAHVRFQCERLAMLRARRSRSALAITGWAHAVMLAIACVVVWIRHGKAVRGGGVPWPMFWKRTWREFARGRVYMRPVARRELGATRLRGRFFRRDSASTIILFRLPGQTRVIQHARYAYRQIQQCLPQPLRPRKDQ